MQESGQMYLKSILQLSHMKEKVRAVDVAEYMNFSKPSVSRGLNILKDGGYLTIASNGSIQLTESGTVIAEKLNERCRVLTEIFKSIGVDPLTAEQDACKIEHVISDATMNALKEHSKVDE